MSFGIAQTFQGNVWTKLFQLSTTNTCRGRSKLKQNNAFCSCDTDHKEPSADFKATSLSVLLIHIIHFHTVCSSAFILPSGQENRRTDLAFCWFSWDSQFARFSVSCWYEESNTWQKRRETGVETGASRSFKRHVERHVERHVGFRQLCKLGQPPDHHLRPGKRGKLIRRIKLLQAVSGSWQSGIEMNPLWFPSCL